MIKDAKTVQHRKINIYDTTHQLKEGHKACGSSENVFAKIQQPFLKSM
jgi:hypothetical protein